MRNILRQFCKLMMNYLSYENLTGLLIVVTIKKINTSKSINLGKTIYENRGQWNISQYVLKYFIFDEFYLKW